MGPKKLYVCGPMTGLEEMRWQLVKAYAPTGSLGAGKSAPPAIAGLVLLLADETLRQFLNTPFEMEPERNADEMKRGGT